MPSSPLYLRSLRKARTKRVVPSRMPTHRKVRIGGVQKRMPVAYFWKDVISTGEFVHPVTGQKFKVTDQRIDRWVKRYEQMRKRGIEIPTPVDHSDKAEDNRGFVVGARRVDGKLQLLHQVIGEDGVKLASRNRCSVFIDPDFVDERGRHWGEVIAHSAFTPKPVISGQGEFVPFAASRVGGRSSKVPVFYQTGNAMARRNKRKNKLKLSKAVDAVAPAFEPGDSVTLADGTVGTVEKAVDVTAYQITDENGDTLPWTIEDDLEADGGGDAGGTQLSRGRKMAKRNKNGKSALSPKQLRKARKILNLEDDVELTDAEILSRLISANKLRKAADAGLDGDDEDEDLDEDEEDDDEGDEDEIVDEEGDEDDEDDEDEEEDEDEEDDEVVDKRRGKDKKGERRQRVIAGRRKARVRELAGSVGSLSRVPKGTDPATLTLLKRSLKTERRRAIERGAITPEVDQAIADLLFTGGKPNGLALSRVAGSQDPLAFRIYDILRRNKPVPKSERTESQSRLALSRTEPGSNKNEDKELAKLREEVRGLVRGQKKPGKKPKADAE